MDKWSDTQRMKTPRNEFARGIFEAIMQKWDLFTSNPINKYYLTLTESTLKKEWRKGAILMHSSAVERIVAHKIDKITYDELFLTFFLKDSVIQIGELDYIINDCVKFSDAVHWMHGNFSSISNSWQELLNGTDGDAPSLELFHKESAHKR